MKRVNKILAISLLLNVLFISYGAFKTVKKIFLITTPVVASTNNTTYKIKTSIFNDFTNKNEHSIIFLGDSLTDNCEWSELLDNPDIRNRGISGDTTKGVLDRISEITNVKPQKVFIMTGINDIGNSVSNDEIISNYKKILENIKENSPNTQLFIQSVLPINNTILKDPIRSNEKIMSLNKSLKELSQQTNLTYIDLYTSFVDNKGNLNDKFTVDGLHLNGQGYLAWKQDIKKYISEQ